MMRRAALQLILSCDMATPFTTGAGATAANLPGGMTSHGPLNRSLYRTYNQPLTNGAATLIPPNVALANPVPATPTVLNNRTRANVDRNQVRVRVGFSERDERRSGNGPNHKVEKRRREKTWALVMRRDARTVEPDKAAVSDKVEGRGARRAKVRCGARAGAPKNDHDDVEVVIVERLRNGDSRGIAR